MTTETVEAEVVEEVQAAPAASEAAPAADADVEDAALPSETPSEQEMLRLGNYLAREFDWELREGETFAATAIRLLTQAKISKREAVAQATKELLARNLIETSRLHRSIARTALLNHATELEKAAKKDALLGMSSHAEEKLSEASYINDNMLPLYQEQQRFNFDRQTPASGDPAPPEQTDLVAEAAATDAVSADRMQTVVLLGDLLVDVFGESVYDAPIPPREEIERWAPEELELVGEFVEAVAAARQDPSAAVPEIPEVLAAWVSRHVPDPVEAPEDAEPATGDLTVDPAVDPIIDDEDEE